MSRPNQTHVNSQAGAVLVISLIFLAVLTLIGVVSMQSTALDYTMTRNAALKDRAFYSSESGRNAMSAVLGAHVVNRGWTAEALALVPPGLAITNTTVDLTIGNDAGENPLLPNGFNTDATYLIDEDGDGIIEGGDVSAQVAVYKTRVTAENAYISSGYKGMGKNSNAMLFYEIRSIGTTIDNASAMTAAEYRAFAQ